MTKTPLLVDGASLCCGYHSRVCARPRRSRDTGQTARQSISCVCKTASSRRWPCDYFLYTVDWQATCPVNQCILNDAAVDLRRGRLMLSLLTRSFYHASCLVKGHTFRATVSIASADLPNNVERERREGSVPGL